MARSGSTSATPRGADDIPDNVRGLYAKALVHEAAGNLRKAYSALSKARMKQLLSVDFWVLHVRVWRGLGKKERILWDKIIGNVESAHPESTVFALVRACLADDEEGRFGHRCRRRIGSRKNREENDDGSG